MILLNLLAQPIAQIARYSRKHVVKESTKEGHPGQGVPTSSNNAPSECHTVSCADVAAGSPEQFWRGCMLLCLQRFTAWAQFQAAHPPAKHAVSVAPCLWSAGPALRLFARCLCGSRSVQRVEHLSLATGACTTIHPCRTIPIPPRYPPFPLHAHPFSSRPSVDRHRDRAGVGGQVHIAAGGADADVAADTSGCRDDRLRLAHRLARDLARQRGEHATRPHVPRGG